MSSHTLTGGLFADVIENTNTRRSRELPENQTFASQLLTGQSTHRTWVEPHSRIDPEKRLRVLEPHFPNLAAAIHLSE
jgi:hypothetical protein